MKIYLFCICIITSFLINFNKSLSSDDKQLKECNCSNWHHLFYNSFYDNFIFDNVNCLYTACDDKYQQSHFVVTKNLGDGSFYAKLIHEIHIDKNTIHKTDVDIIVFVRKNARNEKVNEKNKKLKAGDILDNHVLLLQGYSTFPITELIHYNTHQDKLYEFVDIGK